MNVVDHVLAQARATPDLTAVREDDRTWRYAELAADVRRGANALARREVGAGDRVLLAEGNSYEFVVATLSALARRAVVVPVNTRFQRRELAAVVDQVAPSLVVASPQLADRIPVDHADIIVTVADTDESWRSWPALRAEADAEYRVPHTAEETDAFVLHTSGTTAEPKAAVHTHGNLHLVADACRVSYELSPASTFMGAVPFYHCTGLSIIASSLSSGTELLAVDDWDPGATLRAIDEFGVTVFSGVPAMYNDWLSVADEVQFDGSSMATAVIGGAGVTADLIADAEALLGCPVLNGYGTTETFIAGVWEDRHGPRKRGSVGRATDRLVEVRIVDPGTGEELPQGETGELLVRGPCLMEGYLGVDEADQPFTDGWFHTGDAARVDADGYLFVVDRLDNTIITGGENVYPREVEAVIEELDDVVAAAVVGRVDDRKGEQPVAVVERRSGSSLDAEAIRQHCLSELAAYKHPREVHFGPVPRTSTGKIDRGELQSRIDGG